MVHTYNLGFWENEAEDRKLEAGLGLCQVINKKRGQGTLSKPK